MRKEAAMESKQLGKQSGGRKRASHGLGIPLTSCHSLGVRLPEPSPLGHKPFAATPAIEPWCSLNTIACFAGRAGCSSSLVKEPPPPVPPLPPMGHRHPEPRPTSRHWGWKWFQLKIRQIGEHSFARRGVWGGQ